MSTGEALLSIEPRELQFPFELEKQISCFLRLTNRTNNHVAFKVKTTNPDNYFVLPNIGVVLPHSTCEVIVTMQAQKEAPPNMKCMDKFLLQSVVASPGATLPDLFYNEFGNQVEECHLEVSYVAPPQPPSPLRQGSEEGSPPRASVSENGTINTIYSTALPIAYAESHEIPPETRTFIAKLIEERDYAIQQYNKLQQELHVLRKKLKSLSITSEEEDENLKKKLHIQRFSLGEIINATEGFKTVLGEGSFGKVYRGKIFGKEVAMKRMSMYLKPEQGIHAFQKEIDLLSGCNQVNIISLVGYCDEGAEKILVYEYMSNGSLYDYLHNNQNLTPRLTVEQRLDICIGVAKGLDHLHSGNHFNIIHSDVKTENILLDANLVPKISDFGLSRTRDVGPSGSKVVTKNIQGTEGYLAPECYEPNYKLSRKVDVYAFGVVLLEVLCERPPWKTLVVVALPKIIRGELDSLIPQHVKTTISLKCLGACEKLIGHCLENDPNERPVMSEVVKRLKHALQLQKQNSSTH